jgi:hypothetical protein
MTLMVGQQECVGLIKKNTRKSEKYKKIKEIYMGN